ncbi:NHL domain-containing thioredoxin family protein [Kocuria sp.]|uniref:NHL domain-containing thioredoxin family protein n=1 Tax=Kocuria sp. TaxID=1871328 RepID=UPI0026DAEB58|nr:NHL domain-containing thioredoxin family protein [Kocuria sp.]MDO4918202.1 NHL domain-containing thioredoxin family protein [Kocuria sp.]
MTTPVRASELTGRAWLNTGGEQLDLQSLRGKIVVLDFWSFCCINCLHVLDELRPLEEEYGDVVVTVGVHSPKFEHEADPDALAAAVDRYEITHPVLDDPRLQTWDAYTARAWPTLVVVDPEGYIVAHLSGEGHAQGLTSLVEELVAEHEAKGTLHRGTGPYVPRPQPEGDLRFPGKVAALPDGSFMVSDTGHHRLVQLESDLTTVRRAIGSGTRGWSDGPREVARFNEPQGIAVLPPRVRTEVGYDLVVADTVNHRLRGVDLGSGAVRTVAGSGVQRLLDDARARGVDPNAVPDGDPAEVALSSPWDLVWSDAADTLVVAMAGTHQLFSFDPRTGALAVLAGTGDEGLRDGPAPHSWFAQPSGLAQDAHGTLWVADSESSALRSVRFPATTHDAAGPVPGTDGEGPAEAGDGVVEPEVDSAVGLGLFDFGFRDGPAEQARLQHCLGVAVLPDGSVAVADTYNGAVRRYDPATREVTTLTRGLAEPSDVLLDTSNDEPVLVVVETNAHRLVRVAVPQQAQTVDEGAAQMQRRRTPVASGELELAVRFAAPMGQKLDTRWGDPTQLKVSSSPEDALAAGGGTSRGLTRTLRLAEGVTEGVLHVTARAAACDGSPDGEIPEHAACHLYQQDWGIPFTVDPAAPAELTLELRGLD